MNHDFLNTLRRAVRRLGIAGGAAALLGCADVSTPPSTSADERWIAMTLLQPGADDFDAPWFARAASLTLRDELAATPGLMVIVPPPVTASGVAPMPPQVGWIASGRATSGDGRTRFDIILRRRGDPAVAWQRSFEYPDTDNDDASRWRREVPAAIAGQVGLATARRSELGLGGCRSGPAARRTLRGIEAFGNYRTREDLLRVRTWLEEALTIEPSCSEAQAHRAMTYVSELANRWHPDPTAGLAMADRLSREAAAANPEQPFAHMARAQVLRSQGRVDAALEEATILTRLDPSNGLFLGRVAALQFDAGNAVATVAAAERMQRLPNGTLAAQQQGLVFEALGRYSMGEEKRAAAVLRQLLQINPKNGLAWQMLASLAALDGRGTEAAEHLKRFLELAPAGQTIARLRANETTVTDATFKTQRERYYEGLRRAGLPD